MLRICCFVIASLVIIASCKKWSDPAPTNDPRLTNPYCNDPDAVNYNWGFPGKPDNSVCFYPTDIFKGTYAMVDSIYSTRDGYYLKRDSVTLQIYALSKNKLAITGFCSGDTLKFTAGTNYIATVDSLIGDTTTNRGQYWCRRVDTAAGTVTYNKLDSVLYFNLLVTADSGQTNHVGKARLR